MSFLRTLTNALLSALLFCVLLALLVTDLNINLAFSFGVFFLLVANLMVMYGLPVTLAVVIVHAAYRFISGRRRRLPFVSTSFLTLSTALLTLAALVITRENTGYFAAFFVPGFQSALKAQLVALLILAVAGLAAHFEFHHGRPRRIYFPLYFALLAGVLAFSVWQRFDFPSPQRPLRTEVQKASLAEKRVTLLALQGLSFEFILPLVAEGKLPNFAALMENGSFGRLEGFTPNDSYILRHTVETGKYPGKHRLISEIRYSLPGLPGTLEIVPRFILFRQFTRLGLLKIGTNSAPPRAKDLWRIASDFGIPALAVDSALLPVPRPSPDSRLEKAFNVVFKDIPLGPSVQFDRLHDAFLRDEAAQELAALWRAVRSPRIFSLTLNGLDFVESYFYKYSVPEAFGEIKQEELQKYGPVIRRYYQYYDQVIGKGMAALKDDELLIVYSPHGIEPLPFWKRMVEWMLGNGEISAYHEQAPDGAVFFFGKGIGRSRNLASVKLVDILPTLLYALRLPVGKDMDGIVRGAAFTAEFTEDNPVHTISSYEDMEIRLPPPPAQKAGPAAKAPAKK